MARFNASSLVLLLLVSDGLCAAEAAYNVASFGAKPDGRTDSSGAFASAWSAACRSQEPATVYVPNGHFLLSRAAFSRPCYSRMTLQIDGTLVAPSDYTSRGDGDDGWIVFDHVDGLTVSGGTIDGHGEALWACKAARHGGCRSGAASLEVLNSRNVVISGLTSVDSELYHVVIHGCEGVTVQDVKIKIVALGSSPNTDGIHVQASSQVTVTRTSIQTGDDCVSVSPDTTNLRMEHVSSGPRHGISSPRILTVDQGGKGDYRTIQEAINAVPARAINSRINVNPGIYTEKVVVNKPGVSLIGRSATSTIIKWSGPWDKNHQSEFALHVQATDFVAANLTFQNPYGVEGKGPAVAAKVEGDRAAFYDCRFISFQDTLLDAIGRHYYSRCYIEGATDFIFGTGKAFFERCHLHSTSRVGGAFTAQRRCTESENTGFSFYRCELTGTRVGTAILGRPWGPYARVVFALCDMSNAVAPVGWSNWGVQANNKTAFFGQFQCHGQGSRTQGRVKWAHNNLSRKEAEPFLTNAWVDGKDWIRPPQ